MIVTYTQKAASEKDIFDHLIRCSSNFFPPLEKKVELTSYSKKIYSRANRFEAWIGNTLIGLVAAYFNDPEKKRGFITIVSIAKEYMGRGIASYLLNGAILYAKEKHFSYIELEVDKANKLTISFYESFGFHHHGKGSNSIFMRLNIKED